METFCVSDFNTFALGAMLKPGSSDNNDEAFVQMFMEEKLQSATNGLYEMFWKGSKTNGSGNLALTNGILHNLVHTSQSASTVSATTAVTVTNILDTVNWMIQNAPAALIQQSNVVIYMTSSNFRLYIAALQAANNYHFTGENNGFTYKVPGYSNITVVGLAELDGNADNIDMIMTYAKNFVYGVDTTQEGTSYDLWYSQDNRQIRSALETKIGTAIREPNMVVIIK